MQVAGYGLRVAGKKGIAHRGSKSGFRVASYGLRDLWHRAESIAHGGQEIELQVVELIKKANSPKADKYLISKKFYRLL